MSIFKWIDLLLSSSATPRPCMHVTSTDPLRALRQGHFHSVILSATVHAFNLVVLHSRLVRFAVFSIDQTVLLSQYLIDLTLW